MKLFFVYTKSAARTRAEETLLRWLHGGPGRHEVISMETAPTAARRLTTRDLAWADVVAVMEPRHLDAIRQHWPHHAEKVMVLEINDFFLPDEVELREALEARSGRLVGRWGRRLTA